MLKRPFPPEQLRFPVPARFEPADDVRDWIVATFIDDFGRLANLDHRHLQLAQIGVLWTNVGNKRQMRMVAGEAQLMPPNAMGAWARAKAEQQVEDWFGEMPDFVLTFYAPAAMEMDDPGFCALVEHELYHCAQEVSPYGAPKFTKDGRPKFAIRGHDVEEFVGVVARYGVDASGVRALTEAAKRGPTVARASIAAACGTCLKVAA